MLMLHVFRAWFAMIYAIFGFNTPNPGDDLQALMRGSLLPNADACIDFNRLGRSLYLFLIL